MKCSRQCNTVNNECVTDVVCPACQREAAAASLSPADSHVPFLRQSSSGAASSGCYSCGDGSCYWMADTGAISRSVSSPVRHQVAATAGGYRGSAGASALTLGDESCVSLKALTTDIDACSENSNSMVTPRYRSGDSSGITSPSSAGNPRRSRTAPSTLV